MDLTKEFLTFKCSCQIYFRLKLIKNLIGLYKFLLEIRQRKVIFWEIIY